MSRALARIMTAELPSCGITNLEIISGILYFTAGTRLMVMRFSQNKYMPNSFSNKFSEEIFSYM